MAAVVAWLGFTSLFASVAIGDYLAQAAPTTGTPTSRRLHCWTPSTLYPRLRDSLTAVGFAATVITWKNDTQTG